MVRRVIPSEETEAQEEGKALRRVRISTEVCAPEAWAFPGACSLLHFTLQGPAVSLCQRPLLEVDIIVLPQLLRVTVVYSRLHFTSPPASAEKNAFSAISFYVFVTLGKGFTEWTEEEGHSRQCAKRVQKCGSRTE